MFFFQRLINKRFFHLIMKTLKKIEISENKYMKIIKLLEL